MHYASEVYYKSHISQVISHQTTHTQSIIQHSSLHKRRTHTVMDLSAEIRFLWNIYGTPLTLSVCLCAQAFVLDCLAVLGWVVLRCVLSRVVLCCVALMCCCRNIYGLQPLFLYLNPVAISWVWVWIYLRVSECFVVPTSHNSSKSVVCCLFCGRLCPNLNQTSFLSDLRGLPGVVSLSHSCCFFLSVTVFVQTVLCLNSDSWPLTPPHPTPPRTQNPQTSPALTKAIKTLEVHTDLRPVPIPTIQLTHAGADQDSTSYQYRYNHRQIPCNPTFFTCAELSTEFVREEHVKPRWWIPPLKPG